MEGEQRWRSVVALVSVGLVIAVLTGAGLVGGMPTDDPGASLDAGATIEQQGNFAVTIDSTNAPIQEGEWLTVSAEIGNTLDADDTQEITLEVGGIERDSVTLTLQGGDSETITLEWQTESGDAGDYEAVVSSAGDSGTVDVAVEPAAEEAFFAVTIDDTNDPVVEDEVLEVAATITNTGDEADTREIALVVGDIERDSTALTLQSGDSETVILQWQTDSGDAGDYEVIVSSADDSDVTNVIVEEQPDSAHFSVTIVGVTTPVEPGEPIAVEAEITNTGDEAGEQEIELLVNDERVDDPVVVSLAGGESQALSWETTVDEAGSFEFVVTSADDTDSTSVSVEKPPVGPQLEVAILDSTYDRESDSYTTRVQVTNTGDEPGSAEVELLIDGEPFPDPVVGEPAEHVEPGESAEFELTWSDPGLEPGTYELTTQTGDDSDTAGVTIESIDEDGEPTEDDSLSMIPIGLAIGGVLVITGALLYRRRRGSTSTTDDPGVVTSTAATDSSEEPESERLRSVPVPPPAGEDDCEDEREKFAAMLADLEEAMADAAAAQAEAEAAAERAEAAAEESEAAEDRYDQASDELDSAQEARDDLQDQVDEAREAAREAQEEREQREREHRRVRDQVTSLQRQLRQMDEEGASQYFKAPLRKQIHELKQERRELSHAHRDSIEAANEAEAELGELEDELDEAEEALEAAQEAYQNADAEAEAKHQEAEEAEADAQAAAEAAEAAAEKAEALLGEAKAAAEEYGECVEGYLDALEEQAEQARKNAEQSAEWAEKEREVAEKHAEEGDSAAEEAFPEGDPAGAAGEHYEDGKNSRDSVEGEAENAGNSANEAGGTHEEAERMRELLEEFRDGLRERGLPGADDIPSGDETEEKTREDAERATEAAEAARRSAEGASELFSQCKDGETKPTDEEYVERTWKLHDSEPVEIDFGPWVYDGASDHTDRGQSVKQAIDGLSTLFRRLNQALSGDVAEMLSEMALEMFDGDVDENTQEELEQYIEALLEQSGAETEIKGKAGIPAEYYAALFSAAEELLEGASNLREQIRENRDIGDLEITVTILVTERISAVELVCIDGRWVKRVGDLVEENTWTDTETRTLRTRESEIHEEVRKFVNHVRDRGTEGKSWTRSTE